MTSFSGFTIPMANNRELDDCAKLNGKISIHFEMVSDVTYRKYLLSPTIPRLTS